MPSKTEGVGLGPAIDVHNLTKKFQQNTAVEDLTFHVDKGEVFGLLGPNGAGKTTTVRILCSLIPPTSGSVSIGGYDIANSDGSMKARKLIGLVPDNVGLYDSLSAVDNLEFYGRMYEAPEKLVKENIEKYLKMLGLWDKRNETVGTYSKGMKQKVAVARAIIHDPEILIMDEPTANLDPEAAKTIRDFILELKKENRTIMLNTHNLDEAQRICTKIGVLKTRLIAVDTPANLEKSLSGNRISITLAEINSRILQSVKDLNLGNVAQDGETLLIDLVDMDRDTPLVVSAIAAAGGKIRAVNELKGSLEDAYFNLVKEK
ncbi:MAG: ABC transporter ATP-binding protein [Thermoplasmataceae archaeon]|jgi:ABC-2 type transport system ATP-binding protein|nr:ABC transporter ATP-binding protein [Candidatus Thermoplasmatota archaeon]